MSITAAIQTDARHTADQDAAAGTTRFEFYGLDDRVQHLAIQEQEPAPMDYEDIYLDAYWGRLEELGKNAFNGVTYTQGTAHEVTPLNRLVNAIVDAAHRLDPTIGWDQVEFAHVISTIYELQAAARAEGISGARIGEAVEAATAQVADKHPTTALHVAHAGEGRITAGVTL